MIDMLYPLIQGLGGGGVHFIPSTTGTNAYVAAHEDIDEYAVGLMVAVTFTNASTGNVTLNINGMGARAVLGDNNVQLRTGEILAASTHLLIFDGTRFLNVSQKGRLTAAQMATALAGLTRNIGTTADILATDTVLGAFGKAISLASPLTGYSLGTNTAIAANQTLRAALGNLQAQVNNRLVVLHRGTFHLSQGSPAGAVIHHPSVNVATTSVILGGSDIPLHPLMWISGADGGQVHPFFRIIHRGNASFNMGAIPNPVQLPIAMTGRYVPWAIVQL